MKNRPICPPGLIVVEVVLDEPTGVEHAEMRTYAWPRVRRRLAPIVEAGPDEPAGNPATRREMCVPGLRRGRPPRRVRVVRTDISANGIVRIDPARRHRASRFGAPNRHRGFLCVKPVGLRRAVIEALNVDDVREALT